MTDWRDRQEVKLGDLGESLVDSYIAAQGVVLYKPTSGPHPFDRLCATLSKRSIFVGESKTKARRIYYPDTGFNVSQYRDYQRVREKYRLRIFIFFVDHDLKKIYGNWLEELEKPREVVHRGKAIAYPWIQKNKSGTEEIYFPLEAMQDICDLTEEAVEKLAGLSKRSRDYADAADAMSKATNSAHGY